MLVKNWMSQNVITVKAEDAMDSAIALMKENHIKLLPVMKKGHLVGIVSDRDLKRASASDATSLEIHELLYLLTRIKIKDVMTKDPVTVPEDFTIEETAEVLLENNISGVPVVGKQGKLTGIITQADIFRVLIGLTGVGKRGLQLAFEIEDHPGSIKELTDIIRQYGGRLASVLSTYEKVPAGRRKVYIRAYDLERPDSRLIQQILKTKAKMLYVVDHRDNIRTIN